MRWSVAILSLGAMACSRELNKSDGWSKPFSGTNEDTAPVAEDTGDAVDSDVEGEDTGGADSVGAPIDTAPDVVEDTAPDVPSDTGGGTDTGGVEIVADSVAEYSGTQGDYGWWYGYVEPSTSTDWVEMTHYLTGVTTPGWYADPSQYWTSIADDAAHPNGLITSEGRSELEQWAVRRWVSDEVGLLTVHSHLAKNYEDGTTNGVAARVMVDGVEAMSWKIEGWDDEGTDDVFDITVAYGSTVDFVLDPYEAEDLSDRTTWTIIITK